MGLVASPRHSPRGRLRIDTTTSRLEGYYRYVPNIQDELGTNAGTTGCDGLTLHKCICMIEEVHAQLDVSRRGKTLVIDGI